MSETAAHIARFAGAYNLPGGEVPVIDGLPYWPWDERVARQRLVHVAKLAGIRLTGDELLIDSGSNDAWRIGDRVLRVCWRGDIDRLVRESTLIGLLPATVPHASVDDCGRDDTLSWVVSPQVAGLPLADLWGRTSEDQLRDLTREAAAIMRAMHRWSPSDDVATMLGQARQPPEANVLSVVGALGAPTDRDHQASMVEFLRSSPFMDAGLLDAVSVRIQAAQAALAFPPEEQVFIHGDFTPGNMLVDQGEVSGVLDFEYARVGPVVDDLALPWIWIGQQQAGIRAGRFLDWLREDYPEPFQVPNFAVRREIAEFGFALRVCIVWPPDRPESQLTPEHPLHQLRRLAEAT